MTQAAEPAQHGRDQRAHEGAVALVQRRELTRRIEKLVQRATAADDAVDDVGGDDARREPARVVIIAGARPVPRAFAHANPSLRERHGYAKSEPMPTDAKTPQPPATQPAENRPGAKRPLSPAAERALAEAAARRAGATGEAGDAAKEVSGRGGLDPTRYGDWEINGLASDF